MSISLILETQFANVTNSLHKSKYFSEAILV